MWYVEQPPDDLHCQPYDTLLDPTFVHLSMACEAMSAEERNFSLHWIRELPNGECEDLGCPVHHIDTPTQQRCLLRLAGQDPPAKYWCEVKYDTCSGEAPMRSNVFRLEPFYEYHGGQCETTQSDMKKTCADPTIEGQ